MNVLVIPEDFRKDQYMLKPIVVAMMKSLGKPRATVRVCQDPLLGGIGEALKWERIQEILERYKGMVDLFLLCVDRDGNDSRKQRLVTLEERAAALLRDDRLFLAENAWQEIEVWVLAGHNLPKEWNWRTIRAEIHPKERYFEPFATRRNLSNSPGQGRKLLAEEAVQRYSRICLRCDEVVALKARIHVWVDSLV